ncbi:amidohydrolase [Ruminococcaceae bacterium OttesenSCG-928-D13]|nr:amidohydrolase [Ruminococcaceae bacterium OttesenSCG-928-D13]
MRDVRENLLEQMARLPVVDSHSHLVLPGRRAADVLAEYTGQYLGHDLITAGMPRAQYERLADPALPLDERFALAKPWLGLAKHTGYYRCVRATLRELLGVDDLTESTLAAANAAYQKALRPEYYDELFARLNIRACLIDHTGFDWPYEQAVCVQAYNTIHLFTPYSNGLLEQIAGFSGVRVRGFDSYLEACEGLIRKKVAQQGVRVLKFPIAYTRKLSFPVTAYGEAEAEFNAVFSRRIQYRDAISSTYGFDDCPNFQNYLMHRLMALCEELELTCQFHTGFLAGHGNYLPNSRPTGLIPLIFQYPGVRFDLFHMAYPYQAELGAMAKNYPNISVNMCWAHIISPTASVNALAEWLDLLPVNKIIGFGSDVGAIDLAAGGLLMAKENIAAALAAKIEQGLMDVDEAVDIAARLLYHNPAALYRLPGL